MSDDIELRSSEVDLRELARLSSPTIVRMAKIFGWTLLIAATATFALSRLHTPYRLFDFLFAMAIAAVLMVLGSPTQRAHAWRWQMRRSPLYAPQTFTVRDTAFEIASPKARSTVSWRAFRRVSRRDDRLFLFVSRQSAYIVPRRAFASDREFEEFVAEAEERWEKRHHL